MEGGDGFSRSLHGVIGVGLGEVKGEVGGGGGRVAFLKGRIRFQHFPTLKGDETVHAHHPVLEARILARLVPDEFLVELLSWKGTRRSRW